MINGIQRPVTVDMEMQKNDRINGIRTAQVTSDIVTRTRAALRFSTGI